MTGKDWQLCFWLCRNVSYYSQRVKREGEAGGFHASWNMVNSTLIKLINCFVRQPNFYVFHLFIKLVEIKLKSFAQNIENHIFQQIFNFIFLPEELCSIYGMNDERWLSHQRILLIDHNRYDQLLLNSYFWLNEFAYSEPTEFLGSP